MVENIHAAKLISTRILKKIILGNVNGKKVDLINSRGIKSIR